MEFFLKQDYGQHEQYIEVWRRCGRREAETCENPDNILIVEEHEEIDEFLAERLNLPKLHPLISQIMRNGQDVHVLREPYLIGNTDEHAMEDIKAAVIAAGGKLKLAKEGYRTDKMAAHGLLRAHNNYYGSGFMTATWEYNPEKIREQKEAEEKRQRMYQARQLDWQKREDSTLQRHDLARLINAMHRQLYHVGLDLQAASSTRDSWHSLIMRTLYLCRMMDRFFPPKAYRRLPEWRHVLDKWAKKEGSRLLRNYYERLDRNATSLAKSYAEKKEEPAQHTQQWIDNLRREAKLFRRFGAWLTREAKLKKPRPLKGQLRSKIRLPRIGQTTIPS